MSNPDDNTYVHSGLNDDAEMERTSPRSPVNWQKNLPLLQMVVGVRENLRSRPGGCFQATKWASKCISLLSVGVSS